tara:strand:- start:67 stop:531 length:465 start_codon:yes stop_codon:yes gene_type:complete
MTDKNVFEYMSKEQTLGLGMFINSITFNLVSEIKIKLFDPIFEELFPKEYFLLDIELGKHTIEIGAAIYELFRWVNYATILYVFAKVFSEWIPTPEMFLWLFSPIILLTLMKNLFVHTKPQEIQAPAEAPAEAPAIKKDNFKQKNKSKKKHLKV